MRNRMIQLLSAGVLGLFATSFGQEVYGSWGHYRALSVNTTAGGANVASTQFNVPVLVRLNSTNFAGGFALAAGNGRDVRFAKTNTLPLKYQIESWDSAGQSAAVWVLMDTVLGNNANAAKYRIYYGKSGTADSSNGAAVFSTANNFQGVFHLNEATNDTARDATSNKFKGVPRNRGGSNPANVVGLIGNAKNFLGTSNDNNGGNFRLVTSTGGNTFTGNALNFQNDSSTINGFPLYTISTWMSATSFASGTATRKGIIAKSRGTNGSQYHLRMLDPAIDQINTPGGDTMRIDFADGPTAVYKRGDHRLTPWINLPYPPGTPVPSDWHHVAAIRTGAVGTVQNLRVIVDGAFACSSSTSLTQTTRSDFDVTIGSFSNDSGFFNGKLDEVEFSNSARSDDWIKLAYETQKPSSSILAISLDSIPPPAPAGVTYRTNPLILKTGTLMTPDSVIASTGSITAWVVSPTLPAGMTISGTTGVISGTPTATQAATVYTVTALGPGGSLGVPVTITVNAAPVITNNPVATVGPLNPGAGVGRFGIKATGTPAPTYKWIRTKNAVTDTLTNTGLFTGATTDTLTITNALFADSLSTFKCLATNVAGTAVSTSGTLLVRAVVGILGPYVVHVKGLGNFGFKVPENGVKAVHMSAEDMMGRVVWSKEISLAKSRVVSWNGSGHDGHAVSSGMYVVRMKLLGDGNSAEAIHAGVK